MGAVDLEQSPVKHNRNQELVFVLHHGFIHSHPENSDRSGLSSICFSKSCTIGLTGKFCFVDEVLGGVGSFLCSGASSGSSAQPLEIFFSHLSYSKVCLSCLVHGSNPAEWQ